MNWRQLEAEIADIARKDGYVLDESESGDICILDDDDKIFINITTFARELFLRLEKPK